MADSIFHPDGGFVWPPPPSPKDSSDSKNSSDPPKQHSHGFVYTLSCVFREFVTSPSGHLSDRLIAAAGPHSRPTLQCERDRWTEIHGPFVYRQRVLAAADEAVDDYIKDDTRHRFETSPDPAIDTGSSWFLVKRLDREGRYEGRCEITEWKMELDGELRMELNGETSEQYWERQGRR